MSEPSYKPGQIVFSQQSRSGAFEAQVSRVDETGAWLRLRYTPTDGQAVVTPEVEDPFHTLAVGMFPEGPGGPVAVYEEQQGGPVVLAPRPKGDLSPAVYRRLSPESEGWCCNEAGAFLGSGSSKVFSWTEESSIDWGADSQSWAELSGDGTVTVYRIEPPPEDGEAPVVKRETGLVGSVSSEELRLA